MPISFGVLLKYLKTQKDYIRSSSYVAGMQVHVAPNTGRRCHLLGGEVPVA